VGKDVMWNLWQVPEEEEQYLCPSRITPGCVTGPCPLSEMSSSNVVSHSVVCLFLVMTLDLLFDKGAKGIQWRKEHL
jgi:hypothetical protein